jgi:hypothetical protein
MCDPRLSNDGAVFEGSCAPSSGFLRLGEPFRFGAAPSAA